MHHQIDNEWHTRDTDQVDANDTHYRFVGTVPEFSVFALGTGAEPVSVTDASLSESSVDVDHTMAVSATVENRGQNTAAESIELTVDGEVVDSQTVELDGQELTQIDFEYTPTATGEYTLSVGGVEAGVLSVGETIETGSLWWLLVVLLAAVVAAGFLWRRRVE